LVINQGDSFSLTQIFVSLLGVLRWRDLGLFGDVGVQKKTKGDLLSLFHQRVMKAILTTARHFTTNGAIPSVFACRPQRSLK
jgi:hypothetical protein